MEIYKYLRERGKSTVSVIVEHVDLTQPTVSYHLGEMKKNGILKSQKKGKEVYYSVSKICPHIQKQCVLSDVKLSNKLYVQN